MARGQVNYLVLKSDGAATPSASAQINIRGGGSATVYAAETGGGTVSNPVISDSEGRLAAWLDEGSYDITITTAGVPVVSRGVEIIKGGASFAEADGSITTSKIVDSAVVGAKLASNAVQTAIITDTQVTADKLADAAKLGLTDSSTVRRGKVIHPLATGGVDQRFSTSYGVLGSHPDIVNNLVLPTDGIIAIAYYANWEANWGVNAYAAIFLNSNQLKVANPGQAAPIVQEAIQSPSLNTGVLTTFLGGLVTTQPSVNYSGEVTTGQILGVGNSLYTGGPCYVFAAAGTYSVSVQFKSADGSAVNVWDHKLRAWTIGF